MNEFEAENPLPIPSDSGSLEDAKAVYESLPSRPKWPPDLPGPSGKTEQIFQYEEIPPERKIVPPSASFVGNLLTIRNVNLDLAHARDTLLALRDTVYCPECRCPNWLAEGSGVIIHYENCRLGKLTEVLLKIVPKDDVRFRWKSN